MDVMDVNSITGAFAVVVERFGNGLIYKTYCFPAISKALSVGDHDTDHVFCFSKVKTRFTLLKRTDSFFKTVSK